MIRLTKDNKGITLITLIITVILMLILVSVGTYSGINTYRNAQTTKFLVQMQLVQSKVDELKQNKSMEELLQMGEEVPNDKQTIINTAHNNGEISNNEFDSYRYFSTDDLRTELNLEEGINGEILINFDTREVVSTMGTTYNEITYYTQYLIPGGQKLINNSEQTDRDLRFDLNVAIDGLNATIIINNIQITNATLSYREQGKDYWENITNYTEREKEYNILLSKSATYEFKITDNITGEENTLYTETLKLANKPNHETTSYNYGLGSDKWAYITQINGESYVWIPRFAYDKSGNIKFIKGTSNVTTDNKYIDKNWTVHKNFNQEGTEVTGIWISVAASNEQGLNMLDLLNDSTRIILTEITM